ncbi:hypothetical protein E2C01_003675 [Portunus trituberculatus]|uniref:Uncharacterized protein n=1 Tax=Portunus trituberculatus TaxID=210409 RepID=A0A5B7CMQ7_PORTR|nr:hypothetical protein [Portunus trituberculatus]
MLFLPRGGEPRGVTQKHHNELGELPRASTGVFQDVSGLHLRAGRCTVLYCEFFVPYHIKKKLYSTLQITEQRLTASQENECDHSKLK